MAGNLPDDKVAVLLTREQVKFIIDNAAANERFASNQLLAWTALEPETLEAMKGNFLRMDSMKNSFRKLRQDLEAQDL